MKRALFLITYHTYRVLFILPISTVVDLLFGERAGDRVILFMLGGIDPTKRKKE